MLHEESQSQVFAPATIDSDGSGVTKGIQQQDSPSPGVKEVLPVDLVFPQPRANANLKV